MSNNKMKELIEIVKSLGDSGLLLKGVSETIQNEAEEPKGRFLGMLLDTLGASLLGNILAGKGAIAKSVSEETKSKSQGRGVNRAGEGVKTQGRVVARAGYGNKKVRKTTAKNKKKKFNAASSFN